MVESVSSSSSSSLYFHLPFCTRKCDYCHFFVLPDKEDLKNQLQKGLALEWKLVAPQLTHTQLVSIYFGGGTPVLFGPERISQIMAWIRSSPSYRHRVEVTLEANPEEVTPELLKDYFDAGINRLSIGVQSLDDGLLKNLTRLHNAKKAQETIWAAHEIGFRNVSIDLMYDIPNQTLKSWQRTLEEAAQLPITHLSLYNLTIEPETPFFKRRKTLESLRPPEETSRQMVELARAHLEDTGLIQYEISAYAKPGFHSVHNSGYWKGRPFLGLGPSAFSYWEGKRFQNHAHLGRYCQALEHPSSPVSFEETLEPNASRREHLVLQLRLVEGVELDAFQKIHGQLEPETRRIVADLLDRELLCMTNQRLCLTREGHFFYDTIASELI